MVSVSFALYAYVLWAGALLIVGLRCLGKRLSFTFVRRVLVFNRMLVAGRRFVLVDAAKLRNDCAPLRHRAVPEGPHKALEITTGFGFVKNLRRRRRGIVRVRIILGEVVHRHGRIFPRLLRYTGGAVVCWMPQPIRLDRISSNRPIRIFAREQVGPMDNHSRTIALQGEYDIADRANLATLFGALRSEAPVTIDMTKVIYFDSTVLYELVKLQARLKGHLIKLLVSNRNVRRTLRMGHFEQLFEIVDA